ncbi:MAG: LysR family transcriptional regulator [Myxococcota bacterium]
MDRLSQMRVFTTVVDKESFTTAAEALGMAKSTVSRQVSELETRLGARLLYRTTRVIRPTDVGRAYYERCAGILNDVQEADMAVRERGGDVVRGTLHLAAAGLFATQHLMEPIASFQKAWPDVSIDLRLDDRFVNLVEDGIDVAIRITSRPRDSSLVARKLSTTAAGLFASPAYLAAHGTPRDVADLANHAVVTRDPPGRTWVLFGPDGEARVDVKPVLTCNQSAPVFAGLRLGLGIALLPDFMTDPLERSGELVRILPQYSGAESGVYAVYPHKRLLSGRVRAFIDHLATLWDPAPWLATSR